MLNKSNPIGVMDSGIGGLTVVRELQRILPGEDIIYFGDSANCPYGNKTADQIFELSCHMLQLLGSNGVKCTAVACNTISTMAERLRPLLRLPHHQHRGGGRQVRHPREALQRRPDRHGIHCRLRQVCRTHPSGQPRLPCGRQGFSLLAALVDRGDFNQHDINLEITTQVDNILSREKVNDLILGCTHYPIVEENFHECYPQLHLINPALEQANAVKAYLAEQNALNPQKKGTFTICTSGDPQVYVNVGKRLGLFEASELKVVHI